MYDVVIAILKLVVGIAVFPAVIAVGKSFYQELAAFRLLDYMFLWGAVSYLFVHLFIYSPAKFFSGIQKVSADLLKFAPGLLTSVLPRWIPIIPALVLLLLYICHGLNIVNPRADHYFLFFTGFTLAMHIILTAYELREEDSSILKAHYLFSMTLTLIVNLVVVAFLLSLNFNQFSFTTFWAGFVDGAKDIYLDVMHWMI